MSREKKYTAAGLAKAIDAYFDSISRTVTAKEKYDTGKKDEYGHTVYKERDILNDAGKKIKYKEFVVQPTIADLCLYLGISKQTFNNYEKDEKFLDVITYARGRMEANEDKKLDDPKTVRGATLRLECHYGWKREVKVDMDAKNKQDLNVKIEVVE